VRGKVKRACAGKKDAQVEANLEEKNVFISLVRVFSYHEERK